MGLLCMQRMGSTLGDVMRYMLYAAHEMKTVLPKFDRFDAGG